MSNALCLMTLGRPGLLSQASGVCPCTYEWSQAFGDASPLGLLFGLFFFFFAINSQNVDIYYYIICFHGISSVNQF